MSAHNPFPFAIALLGSLIAAPGLTMTAAAQAPADDSAIVAVPAAPGRAMLRALRTSAPPVLDGALDDAIWLAVEPATGFIQRNPLPGEPSSQRTEARVAYDNDAIYIAIRAYDDAPDSIASQLARRDATGIFSDWVDVMIDSFNDRRSAYRFSVNPHGVKKDVYHFNDGQEDLSWDAVWDVATSIDDEGWTAEFRIPLSQIRYATDVGEQTWGIQFGRTIARREEMSFWAPVLPNAGGFVSLAGTMTGISGLGSPKRLEVLPYGVSKVTRAPEPQGSVPSPFWKATQPAASFGADVRYGLTSNLTLTGTINPDFGQVEADPSVVNLTAFETFFPERRPFFMEGASLFAFNIGDDNSGEGLFYSRRVGRRPQRSSFAGADHVDMPEAATILGAGKVTGRVGSWSLGFLNAVTQAEHAAVFRDGAIESHAAEPLSNYAVGRLNRDFRDGASTVGLMVTATHRRLDDDAFNFLRSAAYSAGVTGQHRFGADNRYRLGVFLAGSSIHGDTVAIQQAQLAPQRYYQRPDATHKAFDPTRTSLTGMTGAASFSKVTGGKWTAALGSVFRTPGFEVNDAGFQQNADQAFVWGSFNYNDFTPRGVLRNWHAGFNPNSGWDFGGTRLWTQINHWGGAGFTNFWSMNYFVNNRWSATSVGALRGGPSIHVPGSNNYSFNVTSDRRKPVYGAVNLNGSREQETGALRNTVSLSLTARPSPRLDMSLQPAFTRANPAWQYVATPRTAEGAAHYIFAELDQTTVSLTTRLSYTVSRDLSFQLYAQPFMSAGDYSSFMRVADPTAAAFDARFQAFDDTEIVRDDPSRRYSAQVEGGSVAFTDPDFNIRSLRTNAVMRWEYRPGSTLFLVWSQGRSDFQPYGGFDFGQSVQDLFAARGTNVLLVKLNYWLDL
jgi:hypothetical protein